MALPKIEYPTFDLTLPSSKEVIKLRPFLVREEKILLSAMQGEDSEEILNSILQVVNNCIITEGVDVEQLATIDLEYIFIKLRSRSVNNVISLTYRDLEDDKKYDVEVDLDKVEIIYSDENNNKIEITDTVGFFLKPPKSNIADKITEDIKDSTDLFFSILKNCIETIYDGENIHVAADSSQEELDEFLQNLDVKTFTKIQKYFATLPKLHYEVKYTNSLGNERTITLSSLNDFFSLG